MSLSMRTRKIWKPPSESFAKIKGSSDSPKKILLHTHLDGHHGWKGATAKMWPVENWVELCKCLREKGWEVSILEWDSNSRSQLLSQCPFLHDGRMSSDTETFESFSEYQCLFSVDSWSKYVAAWYGVPQVVVVPDLRVGYCGFENVSADEFAGWWMHGVLSKKEKRNIDQFNQRRNNSMEEIDEWILGELGASQPAERNAKLHSETPGMMVDRLSIMALKEFHMDEQARRADVGADHISKCLAKVRILVEQQADLTNCLAELLHEISSGKKRFKLYRQLKMYNDPSLNPEIYGQSSRAT